MTAPRRKRPAAAKAPSVPAPAPMAKEQPAPYEAPREKLIGVLLRKETWFVYGFYREAMQGIQRSAFARGYGLVVIDPVEESAVTSADWLRRLRTLVKGLVMVAPTGDAPFLNQLADEGFPSVLLYARHPRHHYLEVDNVQGADDAVEHLIKLGHRRIAFLSGPPEASDGQERFAGYARAMERHGIPLDESLLLSGQYEQAKAYGAVRSLLERPDRPTAVFAANDFMALGAVAAVRDFGLAVPGDMAVVGFDDLEMPRLTFRMPALTTVRQPVYDMAKEGADALILQIEGALDGLRQRIVPAQLIVRHTCGASHRVPGAS